MSVPHPSPHSSHEASRASLAHSTPRRGKALPVSEFTGDDADCTLEDWLPSLERAIMWNAWTEEEQIIQLVGHLKSCALQEWNLLRLEDRASFAKAVEALCLLCRFICLGFRRWMLIRLGVTPRLRRSRLREMLTRILRLQ